MGRWRRGRAVSSEIRPVRFATPQPAPNGTPAPADAPPPAPDTREAEAMLAGLTRIVRWRRGQAVSSQIRPVRFVTPKPAPTRTPAPLDPPPSAPDTREAEALLAGLNHSAERLQTLWFTFLGVSLFLAIAVGTTTHRMLLLEQGIKLPILDVTLPLQGFYGLAPVAYLVFHFYLLMMLVLLARTAHGYETALCTALADEAARDRFRMRMENTLFLQIIAGARTERAGGNGRILRTIALLTLAVMPVALLLMFQLQFLPFHHAWLTWLHRGLIATDLFLVWTLWRSYRHEWGLRLRPRVTPMPGTRPIRFWTAQGCKRYCPAWSCLVLLFAGALATHQDEVWHGNFLATGLNAVLHPGLVAGGCDPKGNRELQRPPDLDGCKVTAAIFGHGAPISQPTESNRGRFPNRIWLPYEDLVDDETLARLTKENNTGGTSRPAFTVLLAERRLTAAVLIGADLRRVDLQGAWLAHASLSQAWVGNARFDRAQMHGASLDWAQMQGASLDETQMQGASLDEAQMQGASLNMAQMQGASLNFAQMQGASLYSAQMQGASLNMAQMRGASLNRAQMQGASLDEAYMQGVSLYSAQMQGASLNRAQMQGASLDEAHMQGASLYSAQMQGASLDEAHMQGASLDRAQMQGASLNRAQMQGASLALAQMQGASLDLAQMWRTQGMPEVDAGTDMHRVLFDPLRDFKRWRSAIVDAVPLGQRRDAVAQRLAILDPQATDPETMTPRALWGATARVSDLDRDATITKLACDRAAAPHVARNLIRTAAGYNPRPSRLSAMNAGNLEALAAGMRKAALATAASDAGDCPGARGLTADDLSALDRVVIRVKTPAPR